MSNQNPYAEYLIPDPKELAIGLASGLANPSSYKVFNEAYKSVTIIDGAAASFNISLSQIQGADIGKTLIQVGIALPFSLVGGAVISERVGAFLDLTGVLITEAWEQHLDRKYGTIEFLASSPEPVFSDSNGNSYKVVDNQFISTESLDFTNSTNLQTINVTEPSVSLQNNNFSAQLQSNNSNQVSFIKIDSSSLNQNELLESSQSFFSSEQSGLSAEFNSTDGTLNTKLLNQSLIDHTNRFLADNTTLELGSIKIPTYDNEGNIIVDSSLYLVDENLELTRKDGGLLSISNILTFVNEGVSNLTQFINDQVGSIFDPIFEALFSTDESSEDENGDNAAERLAGKILADLLLGKDITDIAKDEISQLLITELISDASQQLTSYIPTGSLGKDASSFIQGTVSQALISFIISIAADHRLDSDEYGEAAARALGSAALNANYGGGPRGAAAIAGIISIYDSFKADHSMNSEQYTDTATSAAAAAASAYIGHALGTYLAGVFSVVPFIGTAVGYAIGYLVGYLLYTPLKNINDSNWDGTKEIYDAIEDLIFKGEITSGEGIEENFKQLLRGIDDLFISSNGRFVRDFGIGLYNLFGGNYGQTYNDDEYPNPYSYLQISQKEDGTGNIIQGLVSEGVVAHAREYYHDDIYGSRGSDNLIGKSGTNTIIGYEGNDHIEGRGDADLLVGGKGDDEIFGGNGDDIIYGSEGSDIIFGGAGNDIIVGGIGETSEDGADFIQGGKGDDSIMGEAGNDQISGNEGDDTILGGEGNDQLEGNEGNDSLFGENGNDVILGGAGSDTIKGDAGEDVLYGGADNDNIAAGDGNDEIYGESGVDIIYGDAGNDIANGGSGNDLIFGGLGNDIIYGGSEDDSLYGELGNDYILGGTGSDLVNGGSGDDILLGGLGSDTITSGIGNDTIIFRKNDGIDIIDETSTIETYGAESVGSNTLKLAEISSTLSDGTTERLILTKSESDLIISFKDDAGNIIESDQITITNQFGGVEENGLGSEIIKTIEFSDGQKIDLTNISNLTFNDDNSIDYSTEEYSNIDTTIQEEIILGYNDQLQIAEDFYNPDSTYLADNYNSSGEQEQIDHEEYNAMQWLSRKKTRSSFGGHYTVWYKYYEGNLSGTNGNDRIVGHWWSENIYGGSGDDQLHGGDGSDNLNGGAGDDILHGGSGNDTILGEAGEDFIYGGSGNDNISSGDDNDTAYGNAGNDTINGGNGDDSLNGGTGDDVLNGAAGNDNLEGNDGNDTITDNEGNNVIIAGNGFDIITAGDGNDKIEGNDGSDIINAGNGNNLIYGNGGNDILNAGSGNDAIYGQEGADLINAGAGDDYISGGANDDIINGEDGNDTIFGDLGIDIIDGGAGNDLIYGNSGADSIKGGLGDDTIKGGDSDDLIEGNEGNDIIYGNSGSDNIDGNAGNDTIFGGLNGDVLNGQDGDDIIEGGSGNDILVDGAGSDILDGGADSDIIILTKENLTDAEGNSIDSTSTDTIKNFNKEEDRIILKVNYQNPISFSDIQSAMIQDGDNVNIALDNGQNIIIENIDISEITTDNFQIGLSGGENNDILFGTEGENIIFGEGGDDNIYGGEGNDELWGGKGSDELYGEGGDDILRYEADGKYSEAEETKVYFDEVGQGYFYADIGGYVGGWLVGYQSFYDGTPGQNNGDRSLNPSLGYVLLETESTSTSLTSDDILQNTISHIEEISQNQISTIGSETAINKTHVWQGISVILDRDDIIYNSYLGYIYNGDEMHYSLSSLTFIDYTLTKISYEYTTKNSYTTKNFFNLEKTDITGYNRTHDKFLGGKGLNTILMTEGNDVLTLDDATSASGSDAAGAATSARVQDISVIHAGAGNDVINFSTEKYSYDDVIVYGGTGDDNIWLNSGADTVFGGEGNDEVFSGAGDDNIIGGEGDDVLYGGDDNDVIEGGAGTNKLYGEAGDDTLIAGSGSDILNGGSGSDTVSYANSSAAIDINLSSQIVSGGDSDNDTIFSIENVIGTAFDDIIVGSGVSNTLNGGSGDDSLSGGDGSDTYVYSYNSGIDTITESSSNSDIDSIQFTSGITSSDLTFIVDGDNLEIQVGSDSGNKIIIQDQFADADNPTRIESLKFADDSEVSLTGKISISNEDENLTLDLDDVLSLETTSIIETTPAEYDDDENEISPEINITVETRKSLTSSFGSIALNDSNQLVYQPDQDRHGIDKINLLTEEVRIDSLGNILSTTTISNSELYTLFINPVNDAPISSSMSNQEAKVEEEFSVNINDYFSDVDGDDLTYSIDLNGFDKLPGWINFDSETSILSGKSGRDGKLKFNITATDPSGLSVTDTFNLNIARNILDDFVPKEDVALNQVEGTDGGDVLNTIKNSVDIISGGLGDDNLNYSEDETWTEINSISYRAWNVYSGDEISVNGKIRSFDAFDGGSGYDSLNLTDSADVLFLDDSLVSSIGDIAKISGIEEINAGKGDDIIDFTSLTFSYDNIIINGEDGNDIIWSNQGDDTLNGGNGNDTIHAGPGNDVINGGNGNDYIQGYTGDDTIIGNSGADTLSGGDGNDIFSFTNITDSTISDSDIITDFTQGEDSISLTDLGFTNILDQATASEEELNDSSNLFYHSETNSSNTSTNTVITNYDNSFQIILNGEITLVDGDFSF